MPFAIFLLAALVACALTAAAASAAPEWRFGGVLFTGSGETVEAGAASASLTFPGLTTSCEPFTFELAVRNTAGVGKGEVTGAPLTNCGTNSGACTVESAQALKTPWPLHLAVIGGGDYLLLEAVKIGILYGGEECVLGETELIVQGSAGGIVNDTTHTVTFSAGTFTATGTMLKIGTQKVEMSGVFQLAATGANAGLAVTVL